MCIYVNTYRDHASEENFSLTRGTCTYFICTVVDKFVEHRFVFYTAQCCWINH